MQSRAALGNVGDDLVAHAAMAADEHLLESLRIAKEPPEMRNVRSFVLSFVTIALIVLFSFAVIQITRTIDPADLLPALSAIEDQSAQVGTFNVQRPLAQVRTDFEALRRSVEVQASNRASRTDEARRIDAVSASLAALEDELNQHNIRLAATASEIRGRAQMLKGRVGSATQFSLTLAAIKEFLVAFAWPLAFIAIGLYLLGSPTAVTRLKEFFRPFKSFELFGLKAEISEELKQSAEEAFANYRSQTKAKFDTLEQQLKIRETVSRILESEVKPFLGSVPRGFRCTVHVPDILFENSLYQLIEYLPEGGGSGRTWSVRYGMMGKQWRLGESDGKGEIPIDTNELIRDWGMTRPEARDARRRQQSMVCAILKPDDRDPVGIFYLDAEPPNAFGDAQKLQQLLKKIADASEKHGLLRDLAIMWDRIRLQAPLIRLDAPPAKRQSA